LSNSIGETALLFFEACETGQGWEACSSYCHPNASFSAQAAALGEVSTVEDYTEWMKGLFTPVPDGRYELKCFAVDKDRSSVAAIAVFHGTQTGPGGPVPPTGNSISADYVYNLEFEGGLIKHMTKIWNDTISMQQLGWA
jgi:predicted ester cyclase